jgi:hypothetical protein
MGLEPCAVYTFRLLCYVIGRRKYTVGGNRCRIEIDQWLINRGLCTAYPEVALLCDRAPEVYCGWKPLTESIRSKLERD